jgi:hypothetical protein
MRIIGYEDFADRTTFLSYFLYILNTVKQHSQEKEA